MPVCSFPLIKNVYQECEIMRHHKIFTKCCRETWLFWNSFLFYILTNWITLKEFYINNSDFKNYATKLTLIPFYIALCHTQIPCYYPCHMHVYCCSFFLNLAIVLGWIAFTLEIFLEEVVTSGETSPFCRTMNFPIPRFVYTDSNFRRFRCRAVQVLWSLYMSNQEYFSFPNSFLVIWIIENYLSSYDRRSTPTSFRVHQ